VRKGGGENGSRDAIRGGSALVDGSRIAQTLVSMSEDDAAAFNIPPEQSFAYFAVSDAKGNLAPRAQRKWFKLISVELGNTEVDAAYPAGDRIQAAIPWQPPAAFAGMDTAVLRRIFDALAGEPEPGWHYSKEPRAKYWAGSVLMEHAGKSREQAAAVIAVWLKNNVLSSEDWTNPNRNIATRIVVNAAKAAEISRPKSLPDD
jgi:hypothetical protein